MDSQILKHYKQFSTFTNPGCYQNLLKSDLPEKIEEIGLLVRRSTIHRVVLKNGNTGSNSDLRYGDMTKVPWYRQCEDDNLPTVSAMISELFRRDERGFISDRSDENKLIVTCRFVSILIASILKSRGIPSRVRSGFAPYFSVVGLEASKSNDHWINQYWNDQNKRWVTIDVDGSLEYYIGFNPYDIPEGKFDYSADAWINVREGRISGEHFWNAGGFGGLMVVAWELFYDFHCLMNNEVIYLHIPGFVSYKNFNNLSEEELNEIDELAKLMQSPDENFLKLKKIWDTNKKFRTLSGGLL
jgi:hypothetical protein